MKKINHSKLSKINLFLQIVASIVAILGISALSIAGPLINYWRPFKIIKAEHKVEQIKVTESREYIESVLGIPNQITVLEYRDGNGCGSEGQRAVYNNEFFLLITYYDDSDRCLGYVLISKDPEFSPQLFCDEKLFDTEINDNIIGDAGALTVIGHFLNSRADCSAYHLQYYYHHLGTNACYLGVGISELGHWNDKYASAILAYSEKIDLSQVDSYYEILTNDTRTEYVEKCKSFDYIQPNTFSVFICDDTVDIDSLLKLELKYKLGMSWIDYRRITE